MPLIPRPVRFVIDVVSVVAATAVLISLLSTEISHEAWPPAAIGDAACSEAAAGQAQTCAEPTTSPRP